MVGAIIGDLLSQLAILFLFVINCGDGVGWIAIEICGFRVRSLGL